MSVAACLFQRIGRMEEDHRLPLAVGRLSYGGVVSELPHLRNDLISKSRYGDGR